MLRSERTTTSLGTTLTSSTQTITVRDFLSLLNSHDVKRVQIESMTQYRRAVLSDSGSQFTIYTDDGIKRYGQPDAVVKCAKFKLGKTAAASDTRTQRLVTSIYKEVLTLTHQRLRDHPNILRLLYYDLVNQSDNYVVPALIVERAKYGSLAEHLSRQEGLNVGSMTDHVAQDSALTLTEKLGICGDIIAGLTALHTTDVAHGDVKSDNVLLFENPDRSWRYLAKLSDFGSIIPLFPPRNERSPRYLGTQPWNAPEVENQSEAWFLDSKGVLKCDAYSLGLTIMHVLSGVLQPELMSKGIDVREKALLSIERAGLPLKDQALMSEVIKRLLLWEPSQRCSDLSIILNIVRPSRTSDVSHSKKLKTKSNKQLGRSEADVLLSTEAIFGSSNYLSYGWIDESWTEHDTQAEIFVELQRLIMSSDPLVAGRALFELAIAHAIGFGTHEDKLLALDSILKSAKKGYLPAQAIFQVWHEEHHMTVHIDEEKQIDWLFEAVTWGSFFAGGSLRRLDVQEYQLARQLFHSYGGYNQFFYPRNRPPYMGSEDFRNSISSLNLDADIANASALLEAAVIYGDAPLAQRLLEVPGVDPNFANEYGESLVVLCCKGGHLDVLKLLLKAGATAKIYDGNNLVRESSLHWLIAFEDDQVLEAATLIRDAGAGDAEGEGIMWSHPSIDLLGTFPRAAPLHHAIYCARDNVLETLLNLWPEQVNHTGSKIEGRTPIEYAISLNRASAVEILIEHGALRDLEANRICLSDVSVMENHVLWARNGFSQETGEILAVKCIDAVARAAPSLLDMPEEFGFTPIMQAASNHRRDMVKCFIGYGCNVNTTASYENDGQTALNLLTENHLDNEENDIIDLLLKAGADLDHRTSKGGKHALHFAARDDKLWIARQLLDIGVGVGIVTPYGETPLHVAAYYGSPRVAKLLLDRGANVHAAHREGTFNLKDWKGLTPLAIASLRLRLDFIDMLLDYGASALARPSTGHTVIHLAITEDNLDVLELLLQIPRLCTPEVLDARDLVHGMTALHQCAGNLTKHAPLHLLIEAGADVNVLTDSGFSVLDFVYNTKEMILNNLKTISGPDFFEPTEPSIGRNSESPTNDDPSEPDETLTEQIECSESDETQDQVIDLAGNEERNPELPGIVELHKFSKIDLKAEIRAWDQVVTLLIAKGVNRAKTDSIPESLLSLE